jgi:hypothetical protein
MTKYFSRALFSSTILFAACGVSSAEEVLLRGRSITVGRVYWIQNCQSTLKSVTGVFPFGAPSGVTLSLQKADVTTRQCGNSVPGALVVAKASKSVPPGSYSFTYVVTYDTQDGNHSSNHTASVTVQ